MPTIIATARDVIDINEPPVAGLCPKLRTKPPIPHTKIAATGYRFLLSPKSTLASSCRPLAAIKPYKATQAH